MSIETLAVTIGNRFGISANLVAEILLVGSGTLPHPERVTTVCQTAIGLEVVVATPSGSKAWTYELKP